VDELMALCDQLEAAKTNREQSRDRLVAASLHRLTPPADAEEANMPEAFRDYARFIFTHLPRLTTRPEHIKQLRQTILNLAVGGKVAPQDPNDEPAAQLLKRIQEEKARLLKEGRIKEKTPAPGVQESEQPYQVPSSWAWIRFAELIHHSDAGLSPKTEGFPRSGNHWGVLKVALFHGKTSSQKKTSSFFQGLRRPNLFM
jgi:type I restriction enzyme, S subunit